MFQSRLTTFIAFAFFTTNLVSAKVIHADVIYETRSLSGDPAPVADDGIVLQSFDLVAINRNGAVAFSCYLGGLGIEPASEMGVFTDVPGTLRAVAYAGEPISASDASFVFRDLFYGVVVNDQGDVAFIAYLENQQSSTYFGEGVFVDSLGSRRTVGKTGDLAPGIDSGLTLGSLDQVLLNNSGQTAVFPILGNVSPGSLAASAVYAEVEGQLELVVHGGDPAPECGAESYLALSPSPSMQFVMNDSGTLAFFSYVIGPGTTALDNQAIFAGSPGSVDLVMRTNQPAPTVTPGVTFAGHTNRPYPTINAEGDVSFTSLLAGEGVTNINRFGVFSATPEAKQLVVRSGDLLNLNGEDVVVRGFGGPVGVNNSSGMWAMLAAAADPNDVSSYQDVVLSGVPGAFRIVAKVGDPASGAPDGISFNSFPYAPHLNAHGQTAFLATFTGEGVSIFRNEGIWMTDSSGAVWLVAREGDLFDVNDDPAAEDLRTISDVYLVDGSAGEDSRPRAFNDAGQLAIRLSFEDGTSGVFVARIENSTNCECAGDMNADLQIDGRDIQRFVGCIVAPDGSDCACVDVDGNGVPDIGDLSYFALRLIGGENCE